MMLPKFTQCSGHWNSRLRHCLLLFAALLIVSACAPQEQLQAPQQCSDPLGCVNIAPGDPIEIGVLQTFSGGSAAAGNEQLNGIHIAIKNRQEEIQGHKIKLQIEDDFCSAEGGANAALRLVANPRIIGILGTNCSSAAVTAGKIMSEKGLVMVSSANTSPALTSVGGQPGENWYPGYFRTTWNDLEMGKAAAAFAYQKMAVTQAAVVNAGDAYSKGLTDVFSREFEDLGGKIVLSTSIDEHDANLKPTLQAVELSGAELVFFPFSAPETGVRLVKQARQLDNLQDTILIAGESMFSDLFLQGAGADSAGVYLLGPAEPDSPANQALRQQYQDTYQQPPVAFYYSFAYDAANLLINAIDQAAVRDADGTLSIGRQAVRDALTSTRNFAGVTGSLSCDAYGDCGASKLNIMQVQENSSSIEELRQHVIFTYSTVP